MSRSDHCVGCEHLRWPSVLERVECGRGLETFATRMECEIVVRVVGWGGVGRVGWSRVRFEGAASDGLGWNIMGCAGLGWNRMGCVWLAWDGMG